MRKAFISARKFSACLYTAIFLVCYGHGIAQTSHDSLHGELTLQQCIDYALNNQPILKQSRLDEAINRKDILISLSGWFPQLNIDANLQHYLQLPVAFFPDLNNLSGPKIKSTTGLVNTSAIQFTANQALYSSDLVFAGHAVRNLKLRATQNTKNVEISTLVDVTKSFYDVMLTIEQLGLWNDEIRRLERTREDALHLYQSGLTDKIDYQQAFISTNNAKSQKRNTEEAIRAKYAILKQNMGFLPEDPLVISYDSASLEKELFTDTLNQVHYQNRIEYQLIQTNLNLQKTQIGYYRWSFLPAISAFYDYNLDYFNNSLSPLYNTGYPNSLIGLKLTLPIFQGTNRWQNLRKAHLQYQRLELGLNYLKEQINTQYVEAMGSYKSNLYALMMDKENLSVAQGVFNTVSLQYNQGIKTYLDVIIAETDLRSAKLNYLSSLFQVLTSKLDLKAAMGDITVQ